MKKLLTILLLALSFSAGATSMTYSGNECIEPEVFNDPRPNPFIKGKSVFEVVEDLGNGIFRINLSGGLPRFLSDSDDICIDHESAIGYIKEIDEDIPITPDIIEQNTGLPEKTTLIPVIGIFDGKRLTIFSNSAYSDRSAQPESNGGSTTNTSNTFFLSYTLIFSYNDQNNSFILDLMFRNAGFFLAYGSANFPELYTEILMPHRISTFVPPHPIEYFIEN